MLKHYGVKGMKWGVIRAATKSAKETTDAIRETNKNNMAQERKRKTGDPSRLSDQELRSRVNRMNMEKLYRDLSAQSAEVSAGKRRLERALEITGNTLAITGGILGIAVSIQTLMKDKD